MGGKGAKGAQSTNDQVVAMQQQQAAQATVANQERNARLAYGKQNIQDTFEGTLTGATPIDLSSITQDNAAKSAVSPQNAANVNAALGWAYAHPEDAGYIPGLQAQLVGGKQSLPSGYSWGQMADDGSGTPQYGVYDPSGNLVDSGSLSDLSTAKIYAPGSGAGAGTNPADTAQGAMDSAFGSDFYDKYRQSILDYYMPQEGQQYNTARSSLSYSLARAGQLNSSVAGMDVGNLANQDAVNRAQIASGADTQTAGLRSTVQQDEETALNQLYSTEDPSVAANTAQNMVANANLTKPLLNPAGALFTPSAVGVGNAISGFTNPTAYINPSAGGVGSTLASTSSGSSGAGQTVSG
jgi:hypothetical protein